MYRIPFTNLRSCINSLSPKITVYMQSADPRVGSLPLRIVKVTTRKLLEQMLRSLRRCADLCVSVSV